MLWIFRPTDDRRQVWIENSGNEKLKNIEPTVRKVFCEDHFDPKYLRKQFQRTILRREAVPYPFCEDDQEIGWCSNLFWFGNIFLSIQFICRIYRGM